MLSMPSWFSILAMMRILAVVLVQEVADIHNVLRVAGKAGGDQVKALLDTKQNIAACRAGSYTAWTGAHRER